MYGLGNNMVDYREFRLSKINEPRFRHLKYLLFWPIYLASFGILERVWIHPYYHPVHCAIDDMIPFCEYFLIPYCLWFLEFVFIQGYTLLFDIDEFKRYIRFLIIAFMGTILIYMIYPTCQELRVTEFPRDNVLTDIVKALYGFDTNTNVCPSLHVIGAVAVLISVWHAKGLEKAWIKLLFIVLTVLISLSTVFLKQHSFVDVVAALPVCLVAYIAVYVVGEKREKCKHKAGTANRQS